jgi:hypothetical protein
MIKKLNLQFFGIGERNNSKKFPKCKKDSQAQEAFKTQIVMTRKKNSSCCIVVKMPRI